MIADGDSVARNAFRVALANAAYETPLPIASDAWGQVNGTQELDPSDILEVHDMAEAIARAEKIVGAPRSSAKGLTDIFDALGQRKTDDAIGPAIAAPAGIPTPIPPRFVDMPRALPLAQPQPHPQPLLLPLPLPALSTQRAAASGVMSEDDAYFHPVGRMRSLADVTLDGYRPEPTLLLRARTRRKSFSWILAAALVPLLALAAFAIFSRTEVASAAPAPLAPAVVAPTPVAPVAPVVSVAPPVIAPTATTTPPSTAKQATRPGSAVPVFDVKKLPSAKSRAR
jgi:hypothetical protein